MVSKSSTQQLIAHTINLSSPHLFIVFESLHSRARLTWNNIIPWREEYQRKRVGKQKYLIICELLKIFQGGFIYLFGNEFSKIIYLRTGNVIFPTQIRYNLFDAQ